MNNHSAVTHATPLVNLQGITKQYPGCLANDAIDLQLYAGQIHALLGENGAGKSTLVKVLYGLLKADAGSIEWQGAAVEITSPAKARDLGIALVFQHFSLFESLTVLENIALGMAVRANDELASQITEVSTHYGLPLDPTRQVYSLSVGERQRIEIVRCLLQSPKLLIMDEPTSVLTPSEVSDLFDTLRRLAIEGVGILYISHKLKEIKALCDEATILRNGRRVATATPAEESAESLAALMMGDTVETTQRKPGIKSDQTRLALNSVTLAATDHFGVSLDSISLKLQAGEILGIAGVAGNGQDELMQLISGESSVASAEDIELDGKDVGDASPGRRRTAGLCCVPEERLGHAAVPGMSLVENGFLTAHHRQPMQTLGLFSQAKSAFFANTVIDRYKVQCNGARAHAGSLSGGNLQKFIVGREIMQKPNVLVVSQPTWGVDAGPAAAIHTAIQALAAEGSAVLLISQDLDELISITDRIAALCAGRLSSVYNTADISITELGLLMGGERITHTKPENTEIFDHGEAR